jgi:hypothetical protein
MPTIVEFYFDVYCGICGEGVCRSTDIKKTYNGHDITITCPSCEGKIDGLKSRVEDLEDQIEDLQAELKEALNRAVGDA